ncbi:VOC family protein [Flavihumibacter petaseus]|nr:VOC family protein [Flavihumibacter petaseus]
MIAIHPYLNFAGNTEEAFRFYQSVFGGKFSTVSRFRDTAEASRLPHEEQDKLMHIALPVGRNTVLMATDALESMGHHLNAGNNFSLQIEAESTEEADALYRALCEGGKPTLPMMTMFWGTYFGMLTDKFGIQWMINYNFNQSISI